jgi:UDP-2,3-diacylglucosamine pyrophosphatase LpxH
LEKAKKGTQVVYVPGNHDEFLREYDGMNFNGVAIHKEHIYTDTKGLRFLVTHGDEFDSAVKYSKTLAFIGYHAYDWLLLANQWFNFIRRKLGFPYWSLSNYLKHKVKNAVNYINLFETAVAQEANNRNLDGLICGHIHKANLCNINGIRYCNTGDWVESCTALVECKDGNMAILDWMEEIHAKEVNSAAVKAA